jgi:hypothetical protein
MARVPVEVWRMIVDLSTYVEGELAFFTRDDIQLDQDGLELLVMWYHPSNKRILAELPWRRSIVLISRLWYHLGIELLYRSLSLRNKDDLANVLRLFESESGQERRLALRVKRVIMEAFDHTGIVEMADCRRLVLLCSNAIMYQHSAAAILKGNKPLPSVEHSSLTESKLRYISLMGNVDDRCIDRNLRIHQYHSSFRDLRVLHISKFDPTFYSGSLVFPLLHTLIVDSYMSPPVAEMLGGWEMPCLHNMTMAINAQSVLEPILHKHVATLKLLFISEWWEIEGHDHDLLSHVDLTSTTMGIQAGMFHSLQTFVTTLVVPSGWTRLFLPFPCLQIYCVYLHWEDAFMSDEEAIEYAERHLEDLEDPELTPALQRVCVRNWQCQMSGYLVKEWAPEWTDRFHFRGVLFDCQLLRGELVDVLVSETFFNHEVILKDSQEEAEDMSDERDKDFMVDDAIEMSN